MPKRRHLRVDEPAETGSTLLETNPERRLSAWATESRAAPISGSLKWSSAPRGSAIDVPAAASDASTKSSHFVPRSADLRAACWCIFHPLWRFGPFKVVQHASRRLRAGGGESARTEPSFTSVYVRNTRAMDHGCSPLGSSNPLRLTGSNVSGASTLRRAAGPSADDTRHQADAARPCRSRASHGRASRRNHHVFLMKSAAIDHSRGARGPSQIRSGTAWH
jgi:hypothetical protein